VQTNAGLFVAAHGGTLFLDEIAELPVSLQVKLLRVIEEKQVWAVGATRPQSVDVRIIASTNRDLAAEVTAGRFRADAAE
jgi:transcriptional regulator with PAS, ATPase and Fis domain